MVSPVWLGHFCTLDDFESSTPAPKAKNERGNKLKLQTKSKRESNAVVEPCIVIPDEVEPPVKTM